MALNCHQLLFSKRGQTAIGLLSFADTPKISFATKAKRKKKTNKNISRKSKRIYYLHVFVERRRAHAIRHLSLVEWKTNIATKKKRKRKQIDDEKKHYIDVNEAMQATVQPTLHEVVDDGRVMKWVLVVVVHLYLISTDCEWEPSTKKLWLLKITVQNNWNGIRVCARTLFLTVQWI